MEENKIITDSEYVLVTDGISKFYKSQRVLFNVSMHVKKGDIYGFVGENGAGKTTIIRIICGLTTPESGSYKLFGIDSDDKNILEARKKCNAIVEAPSIYHNLSAYENLKIQMRMIGLPVDLNRIADLLQTVGLEGVSVKKKVGNFSLGMRQRLGIAMCLVNDPEFLILDEPLNGLDPEGIVNMRNLILKLNKEKNITFLISSHILTELSLVATKYGIISRGELVKEISKEELENVEKKETLIKTTDNENKKQMSNNPKILEKLPPKTNGKKLLMTINNAQYIYNNFAGSSIEDYYLSIVGGVRNA